MSLSRSRSTSRIALAAIALFGFTACSDTPMAPTAPSTESSALTPGATPDQGLLGSVIGATLGALTKANGLQWTLPATRATATRVIGPEGGSFGIPGGIQVTVPRGAVSSATTFSVTRLPGRIVAYDFQPHGTTFAVPLRATHPTLGTSFFVVSLLSGVQGAYFASESALDQSNGTANVSEFQPGAVSTDLLSFSFPIPHFSGWMVSTGRSR